MKLDISTPKLLIRSMNNDTLYFKYLVNLLQLLVMISKKSASISVIEKTQ